MITARGSVGSIGGRSTLTFIERYDEMHELGIPDWQIAKKMGITANALERQLARYRRPASDLLKELSSEELVRNRCG